MQGDLVKRVARCGAGSLAPECASSHRAILLAALLSAGPACSSFDELTVARPPPPCKPADVPPAPLALVDPGTQEFVVAVSEYDLGESADDAGVTRFSEIGFDLDKTCTGPDGPWSCREPAGAQKANHTDGPDGRDNAMGGLLSVTGQQTNTPYTYIVNQQINFGVITMLIRVRGYNRMQTDRNVEVAVYGANRKFSPTDPSVPASSGVPPIWDGKDVWNVYSMWLDQADQPAYVDVAAYVTNGILVAHWPMLLIGGGSHLSAAKMAASLVHNGDDSWSLRDAVFAGRVPLGDVFAFGPRCKDAPDYCQLKELTCSFPDINFAAVDDGSHPCDALSLAWQFKADPAQIGVLGDTRTVDQLCPPETSPAGETCDNATCPH